MRLRIILIPLVSIFFIWGAGLIYFYTLIPTETAKVNHNADAIIVLTGGNDRIAQGVKLLAKGKAEKLLISGVNRKSEFSDLLSVQGVDDLLAVGAGLADKISLGRKAVNTVGNAEEAKEWASKNNVKSIILVTANYHMPRALVEFRKLLPSTEIEPYPVFPKNFNKKNWMDDKFVRDLIVREYNKYLYSSID
jgi:uncharacterized SAM-binding protein YcdF (DUF218 family)